MSGKSAQKRKDNNKQLFEQFKNTCPEHRVKDLESLIKKSKGDNVKISSQIQQWWDDPTPVVEEVWEDVSRKTSKKTQMGKYNRDRDGRDGHGRGGGGRGYGRSGDRDRGGRGYGRGMAGGRGGGADRRAKGRDGGRNGGSGRGDRSRGRGAGAAGDKKPLSGGAGPSSSTPPVKKEEVAVGTPAAVKIARPLQGAWGQRAAAAAAAPPAEPPAPAPLAPEEPALPVAPPAEPEPEPTIDIAEEVPPEIDVGVVSSQDPTPAGVVEPNTAAAPAAPKPAPVPSGGNVWATKGSAHLIQKEKNPVVEVSPFAEEPSSTIEAIDEPLLPETVVDDLIVPSAPSAPSTSDALDSGLPASVNGANINAAGWDPVSVDLVQPSPVGPVSVTSQPSSVVDAPLLDSTSAPPPVQETITPAAEAPVAEPAAPVATVESTLKPTSILNMGHWETGEGEESASHDFGFGSFGNENDVASVEETAASNPSAAPVTSVPETVPSVATVSPARPPPGLGIGMPPMPEKIVHVHELENTLEKTSLTTKTEEKPDKVDTLPDNLTNAAPTATPVAVPHVGNEAFGQMPQPGAVPQQSYGGQYGMGMYNYNAQSGVGAPNGFMGVPAAPVLPGGVPPQQQKQQNLGQQQGGLHQQQQASIYGAPAPGNQSNDNSNTESTTPSNPAAGIPPGMHGMPQYNPALFYGQQPYQMGQPHGVAGYGYGFAGQYGGVQAGFGYQQVMGQGAGYGQPPYEDQTQQHQQHQQHHGGNNHQGGYNKNSGGGYRGRNNHHNHNQYQNQYNPQGHGGYGGQPYNMGYNDHFNQRGGYGPGNMDPYMNPGGYHQDDHQIGKGKPKGNSRNNFGNNNGMHNQYQQGGGNQFGGLQGGDSDRNGNNTTSNNNGLSYQGWGNGGL